ncbi:DUF1016 domain-containing protein [Blautia schinkii]|nr:DUF1016 domain-containing protein [Blautia schinkii]
MAHFIKLALITSGINFVYEDDDKKRYYSKDVESFGTGLERIAGDNMEADMDKLVEMNDQYRDWISEVSKRFRQSQIKAAIKVNHFLRFHGDTIRLSWTSVKVTRKKHFFCKSSPDVQSNLAQEITKDPYKFDFITLTQSYNEKELKDALMDNIEKFLLELGNGFAFVGREYRIEIGATENFIDMLFYHIRLRCYVVVEVKVTEFESSYAGQLGTYVVAVNHQLSIWT